MSESSKKLGTESLDACKRRACLKKDVQQMENSSDKVVRGEDTSFGNDRCDVVLPPAVYVNTCGRVVDRTLVVLSCP